ncbi:hypothetical protein PCC6311_1509 [Synechococcus elongatus PCC 6311]|uniref:Uncharacterized protein n=1 Tax=Synechococcus elongatus (strain ATCC 33912 / PCC 7942 / FACHB-805) TaxID=1140 RepID=Q31N95_SYNE7|nr:hypothetical protein Synpcc7942_1444 [Synechococcus elongatus PCC 7942 = FACHB-805]AJD58893.1 hypothetical protein M744_09350 [Synechococcus elongatus UTEX 2973]UOW71259.1 hypothetical protein PCC7943_1510 [Synechococcus elongatus PCC 7943]UOW73979.1 hypothetical protein PCC6311_1509 [Synechococcus elongatus PCC 6311]UOW76700.1 hypothetical protein PCC6301pg_1510 [Synechococcus elongatus PCC 6301]
MLRNLDLSGFRFLVLVLIYISVVPLQIVLLLWDEGERWEADTLSKEWRNCLQKRSLNQKKAASSGGQLTVLDCIVCSTSTIESISDNCQLNPEKLLG